MSGRGSDRKKNFKKGIDSDDSRRKREETRIVVRKEKRDEALRAKRRTQGAAPAAPEAAGNAAVGTPVQVGGEAPAPANPDIAEKLLALPENVQAISSPDGDAQLQGVTWFRKLLSIERSPPIDEVIQSGVVPRFVEFLTAQANPQLQFEAAWALTNIASGTADHTAQVIDNGAVPIFVQLLSSPNDDVREQAVWALGNIAGDSPRCRDLVLQTQALMPLLGQLTESSRVSMLRNATWTLSNFCRGKPQPPFHMVSPALPCLAHLIFSNDEEVLTDACWALSYLSDGTNDKIQAVIEAGVVRRLVELLGHPSPSVQTPALRTVGNIVTGDDLQTQIVINCGALPCLLRLLNSHKKSIRKEACWTISNITAGNKDQIQNVIDCGPSPTPPTPSPRPRPLTLCRRRPCPAADPAARDGGLRREEGSGLGDLERDLGRHAGADPVPGDAAVHPAALRPAHRPGLQNNQRRPRGALDPFFRRCTNPPRKNRADDVHMLVAGDREHSEAG